MRDFTELNRLLDLVTVLGDEHVAALKKVDAANAVATDVRSRLGEANHLLHEEFNRLYGRELPA